MEISKLKDQIRNSHVDSQEVTRVVKEKDKQIEYLGSQLKNKSEDLQKMEGMFQEYASWRGKLELIEAKMKQEVDYWKGASEKAQSESQKLQQELIKLTKEQMGKAREIAEKEEQISQLKDKIEKNGLATVEEALCAQCKSSMEESIVVQSNMQRDALHQADR